MLSSVSPNPFSAYLSNRQGFDQWSRVSRITTNLTRAFSKIGRDPGAKKISLGLSLDEQNLLFSLKNGTVGRALLGATLITAASRTIGSSGGFQTRYTPGRLSSSTGLLIAYQGPNLVRSTRLDTVV
ncbi:MAG: hypothetical protein KJ621_16070 [Proteobacteria bacterium]|nr:hypothetical protein [Pseudomonadota bacterium]MBU1741323.1 hypothetical protein [Pseudomonadota bacterium]